MNPCHLLSLHVLLGCLIFHTETGKGAGFLESQLGIQEEDRVGGLINKMMLNNSVSFAGEGMVGQATFTGNYQWILMNNFSGDAYPPEVYSELHYQFSAGMQVMSVKALGTSLKLTFEGKNQLIYPETWFFMLVVAICVIMQMNYLNNVSFEDCQKCK